MARSGDPRPYIRISVDLPLNPKLARINSSVAAWAYVVSLCYCGASLTDGHFPVDTVLRLAGASKAPAKALVAHGLWHLPGHDCAHCDQPDAGDAVVHDYLRHQTSAADAQELAVRRSEAGRAGATKRWGQTAEGSKQMASAIAGAIANGRQNDGKQMAEEKRREEKNKKHSSSPPDGFDDFWAAYPRHVAKAAAQRAYAKAGKGDTPDAILKGTLAFADKCFAEQTPDKYIPHPATWLNQARWNDHLEAKPVTRPRSVWEN